MPTKEKKSPPRMKLYPEYRQASRKATKKVKKYESMDDVPKWLYPFAPLLIVMSFALFELSFVLYLATGPIQFMFLKPFIKNIYNIKLSIELDKKVKDTEKIMESLEKFKLYKMFKDSIPEKYIRVYLEDDEKTISMYIIVPQKILREKIKSDSSPLLSKLKEANEIGTYYGVASHRVANVGGQLKKKEIMNEIITFFKKFKTINIGREKYKIMEISYGSKKVEEGTDISKLFSLEETENRPVMVVKPHEKKLKDL
jgi:hypothetical protein